MKKRIVPLIAFVLSLQFLSIIQPTVCSQGSARTELLNFADSLFEEGDYLNAAHEYRRYLFLYSKTENLDAVQFRLAASYQNSGNLRTAIQAYQNIIDFQPHSQLIERSQSNIAHCHLLQGNRDTAITSLQQLLSKFPESKLAPRSEFIIATVHMDSRNWEEASSRWRDITIKYPNTEFAEMSDRLARMLRTHSLTPRRSPILSGLLSAAIPGLGQMYSGRFSDGFQSLIFTGITALGTIHYIGQKQYRIAIPVALICSLFYTGNIYGGLQAAKILNHQQDDSFLDGLRAQIYESGLLSLSQPQSTEIALAFWKTQF